MTTMRYNLAFDIPRNRWSSNRLPTKVPARWPRMLIDMRNWWIIGNSTELVTAFVEYFDTKDPLGRRIP